MGLFGSAGKECVELLQTVLPKVSPQDLKALRGYQDRLGAIQDADVLVGTCDEFTRKRPKRVAAMEKFRRDAEQHRDRLVREFLAGVADPLPKTYLASATPPNRCLLPEPEVALGRSGQLPDPSLRLAGSVGDHC
jgi:hypothetical protein